MAQLQIGKTPIQNKTELTYNEYKNDITTCIESFTKFVLKSTSSETKSNVIDLSTKGELKNNSIRPTAWKIMLNVLPCDKESNIKSWIETTRTQRLKYKEKIKESKTLKKIDGDPLGGAHNEKWQSIFEETETKKLILLDVARTYQEKELFCQQETKDILTNILFLWAKEHKTPSYRQGMNEILAVILYAMFPFYFPNTNPSSQEEIDSYCDSENIEEYSEALYMFFHDEKEFECDLFYLFSNLMDKCISRLFEYSETGIKCYLMDRCEVILKDKLKQIDTSLYLHFERIQIDCGMVVQRWLKCMFSREFHIENVMVIWDLIFADEQSYKTKDLQMLDYVSLAMFQYIREHLVEKEENDCFQRLFRYPPVESIVTIIELSKKIKGKFTKKQAFFPIQNTNNNTNKNSNVVSTKKANSTKVVNTNKIITANNEPNLKTKIDSNPKAKTDSNQKVQTDSNPKAKTDSTTHINSPKKPKNSMMDFLISRSNNNKGSNNQNDNNITKTNNEPVTKKGADVKVQETPLPKSLITPLPNTNNQIEVNKNEISKDKNEVHNENKEEKTIIKLKQNEGEIISKNTNEQINLNKENLGNTTEETINEIRSIFIKYKNNMEIDDVNKLEFLLDKLKK